MPEFCRFEKLNTFVDRGQAHLREQRCAAAAMLWFTLWRFENAQTDTVRVGVETLAACYGTHHRNVQRMLTQLEEFGYLEVVEPGKRGRGDCAVYRLFVPLENASPRRISSEPKCVMETLFPADGKCVTQTHISSENASPAPGKCVTQTHVQKVQKKYISADAEKGASEELPRKEKKPRPRNELFDAIAAVTGSAPKASGSHIAKVEKALKEEEPPFTPEEVYEFGRRFWELCPWAAKDKRDRPELGELQKHIGKVRVKPSPTSPEQPQYGPIRFPMMPPRE